MKVFLTALCLQATVTKLVLFHSPTNQKWWSNCFMATWRWCEKIDLQVTYRHSSNLANVERKHNSGVKKRTSKDCKERKCHKTVKSDCRLFLNTEVWNPKAKTTANLRIVYRPTNICLKKRRTNSSLCYGKKDLNKVDAHEKKGFQHTLWTPFTWQCDFETSA